MTDLTREDFGYAAPYFRRRLTPSTIIFGLVQILMKWHQRSLDRHRLANLNDHLLRDVGLTRGDVEREIEKPFWQG